MGLPYTRACQRPALSNKGRVSVTLLSVGFCFGAARPAQRIAKTLFSTVLYCTMSAN